MNSRNQTNTELAYVQSIKDNGIIYGARGEPWLTLPMSMKVNVDPYGAVSYGHLREPYMDGLVGLVFVGGANMSKARTQAALFP